MADEHTGPGERRSPGGEEEFHLSTAGKDELKRLASHPIEEAHRLQEEVREGEKASGLFTLVVEVGVWVWLAAALLIVAIFLVVYFAI